MNEIKEQFRQWLLKENLEKDKAKLYVDVLKKILSKDLDAYLGYLDPLDKNIINHIKAIVLKYYEFSNANYELDRFTIWDAIGYYENVIKPLYHENALINEEDKKGVELYLYDGVDHFLTSISLRDVYEYIVIFNHVVFSQYYRDVYDINEDKQLFINKLEQLRKDLFNINFEDVALRIKYTVPRKKIKKEVLTNFCQFLYDTTKEPKYNLEKDRRLSDVENENHTVDDGYAAHGDGSHLAHHDIVQQIDKIGDAVLDDDGNGDGQDVAVISQTIDSTITHNLPRKRRRMQGGKPCIQYSIVK